MYKLLLPYEKVQGISISLTVTLAYHTDMYTLAVHFHLLYIICDSY